MIEQVMFFALGALVAALAAFGALPALWRRAVRLTRARLEATMPLTPAEIAAEKDQLRARFAIEIRRAEQRIERAETAIQQSKAELGARLAAIQERDGVLAARAQRIEHLEAELADARAGIATFEDRTARLERERDNLNTLLSAARVTNLGLEQEVSAIRLLADQRQVRVGEVETLLEGVNARLAEVSALNGDLRDSLRQKNDELRAAARAQRDGAQEHALLQRGMLTAESIAEDRAKALESLQQERLRLIDEAGDLVRERDHARLERTDAMRAADAVQRRLAEAEATAAKDRRESQDAARDLTQTIDQLRRERRSLDDEASALRFTKARLETDLERYRKREELREAARLALIEGDRAASGDDPATDEAAPRDVSPQAALQPPPQPRPT